MDVDRMPDERFERLVRDALTRWEKPALVPGALPAETVEDAGHYVQEDEGGVASAA